MIAKIAVLLLVGCTMVMASPFDNFVSQVQEVPQQSFQAVQESVGEVASSVGEAYVQAYDEQREAVNGAIDSAKESGQKAVESSLNLIKNGPDNFFFIPKLSRNAIKRAQIQQ